MLLNFGRRSFLGKTTNHRRWESTLLMSFTVSKKTPKTWHPPSKGSKTKMQTGTKADMSRLGVKRKYKFPQSSQIIFFPQKTQIFPVCKFKPCLRSQKCGTIFSVFHWSLLFYCLFFPSLWKVRIWNQFVSTVALFQICKSSGDYFFVHFFLVEITTIGSSLLEAGWGGGRVSRELSVRTERQGGGGDPFRPLPPPPSQIPMVTPGSGHTEQPELEFLNSLWGLGTE